MAKINIVGAGMAGLLAAQMLRRHHDVTVYEIQKELPNNHSAVLRFRTPEVGDVLGIPFKKVQMIKTVMKGENIVADSISYAYKCTGRYSTDRSIIAGTVIADRYVAPDNLIDLMAKGVDIKYSFDFFEDIKIDIKSTIISTVPMPVLSNKIKTNICGFQHVGGHNLVAEIQNCDAYCSVLFPSGENFSRASITGNKLILEYPRLEKENIDIPDDLQNVAYLIGIKRSDIIDARLYPQSYSKILPIDEDERKNFIRHATNLGIYSLGRYATWRPKLLLDDLVNDVRRIQSWIEKPSSYKG